MRCIFTYRGDFNWWYITGGRWEETRWVKRRVEDRIEMRGGTKGKEGEGGKGKQINFVGLFIIGWGEGGHAFVKHALQWDVLSIPATNKPPPDTSYHAEQAVIANDITQPVCNRLPCTSFTGVSLPIIPLSNNFLTLPLTI